MTEFAWEEWRTLLVSYGASVALAAGHIILILIGGWIALRVIRRALHKLEAVLITRADAEDQLSQIATKKRVKTLAGLLRTMATITV